MFSRRRRPHSARPIKQTRRARVVVEELEPRNLLSIFTPAQISHAYGFDKVMFGAIKGNGSGQTIAIVDAYNNPNIASDLHVFDHAFGLPDPTLYKMTPQGTPPTNAGWALEMDLDVEWAHAMAPGATIVLVEAKSASFTDLFNAINTARNTAGVSVVSLSWGADEAFLSSSFENGNNSFFTTPAGHTGVSFVASSGDDGGVYGPGYPAVSPNVLSVGGTSLMLDASGNYSSESGWSGSTGGVSAFVSEPDYQLGAQKTGFRGNPDVSIVADPNTGVYVYTSVSQGGYVGWFQVGGTSVGAPIWSALVAVADQGRALNSKGTLDSRNDTIPDLYSLPSGDFHDVTTGSNAVASAGPGYDFVTGLGSPLANLVISDLAAKGGGIIGTGGTPPTNGGGGGGGGGGGRGGHRHEVLEGPVGQTPSLTDSAIAIALANSVAAPAHVPTPVMAEVVAASAPVVPVTSTTASVTSFIATSSLQLGGDGPGIDGTMDVAPVDHTIDVVPPMPVNPQAPGDVIVKAAPTSQDSTTPNVPVLDELYDEAGTDGRWTAAFAYSDSLLSPSRIEETGANDVTASVAVALGGVWIALAGRPDQRKRPELAR